MEVLACKAYEGADGVIEAHDEKREENRSRTPERGPGSGCDGDIGERRFGHRLLRWGLFPQLEKRFPKFAPQQGALYTPVAGALGGDGTRFSSASPRG